MANQLAEPTTHAEAPPTSTRATTRRRWNPAGTRSGRSGFFRAEDRATKPAFVITMPPPNVTGSLHMGHAPSTRWRTSSCAGSECGVQHPVGARDRPRGHRHAEDGRAPLEDREEDPPRPRTREVPRARVGVEGRLGRHASTSSSASGFLVRLERANASRWTPGLSRAVREAFVRLYEDGPHLPRQRLINWCPGCQTAISDLEVDHEDSKGELFSFAYPLDRRLRRDRRRHDPARDDARRHRHRRAPRRRALQASHREEREHPISGREFPIIADAILVDPTFGTGAVKVTPAHDSERLRDAASATSCR